jgi:hypothetical protein
MSDPEESYISCRVSGGGFLRIPAVKAPMKVFRPAGASTKHRYCGCYYSTPQKTLKLPPHLQKSPSAPYKIFERA